MRQFIKDDSSNILGAMFICPCIETKAKDRVVPDQLVIHKEKNLKKNYGNELYNEFESIAVIQNDYHIKRFETEIYCGLKCAHSDYLEKYRKNGYAFKKDVDNLKNPFSSPTLFVTGKQDHFVGYHDAYKILKNYPRATFSILDEAGHNLQLEKNELFNTLAADWINRIERDIEINDLHK